MSTETKTAILVGGPADGRRQNVLYGKRVEVVALTCAESTRTSSDARATTRLHAYTKRKINFPDGDPVTYYAHEELTDREALMLLLENYVKNRRGD